MVIGLKIFRYKNARLKINLGRFAYLPVVHSPAHAYFWVSN